MRVFPEFPRHPCKHLAQVTNAGQFGQVTNLLSRFKIWEQEKSQLEKRNAAGKSNRPLEKSGLFRIFALAFGRTEVRQIQLDAFGKQKSK